MKQGALLAAAAFLLMAVATHLYFTYEEDDIARRARRAGA